MTQTTSTDRLGSLIVNRDGHVAGPRYGQVYTAPAGETGFIAGIRDVSLGDQLYDRQWFATLRAAETYLVQRSAY